MKNKLTSKKFIVWALKLNEEDRGIGEFVDEATEVTQFKQQKDNRLKKINRI